MRKWIFKKIFSEWIPFRWIDGNKTDIARAITFIFAISAVVGQFKPEYVPYIGAAQAQIITLLGLVGIELGKLHADDKATT